MPRMLLRCLAFTCFMTGLMTESISHAESDLTVRLLGPASPQPRPDRFGPSTLVEVGNQKLLFDAGRGVPIRLRQPNSSGFRPGVRAQQPPA